MQVLIVEDERFAREKLIRLLKNIDKTIEVVETIETVEEAVNWLLNNPHPDLLFMDIELDDGSCFEIFESVNITVPIIFTTAYDEYAIKAFKVNSIDYLLKPIEEENLRLSLSKYQKLYNQPIINKINKFINALDSNTYKSRFLVKIGNRYLSIPVSDIACFYIQNKSTFLRTFSKKNYAIDYSLEELETKTDPKHFFRINRNYIVHINAIAGFSSISSTVYQLKLSVQEPSDELTISRNRVTEFKKWVDK